jgi:hypothetical protein
MKLEGIEHARFRALAQLYVDKDKGVEAFEDYMKTAFPYLDAAKRQDREKFVKMLQQEIARGPISVTPVASPKMRSRLKTKMLRKRPQTREEANKLYRGMGEVVPR